MAQPLIFVPVPSSSYLYREFPLGIRRAYGEVVQNKEPHMRHELLLQLVDTALEYLASLTLSDYRSRAHPSATVEALLDSLRTRNLTLGGTLDLFLKSAGAVHDSLFPQGRGPLVGKRLTEAGRLAAAIDGLKRGMDGLSTATSPSAIKIDVYVTRALEQSTGRLSWWATWKMLVEYRNLVAHAAARRWPTNSSRYYEVFTPLLEAAVVELLTFDPVAEAILDHPIATLTRLTHQDDGKVTHVMCGEDQGVWFDKTIDAQSVTERWSKDEWRATDASEYVLERTSDGNFVIRALFWDLHESPPPPISLPDVAPESAESPVAAVARTTLKKSLEGRGTASGTCGEFAQGPLPDGTQYHVTCPINRSTTVAVDMRKADEYSVKGWHRSHEKLDLALKQVCGHFDIGPVSIHVRQWTDLHVGKGMGSSTADVLAGIRAVANALGEHLTPEVEGALATSVESSDGVMYPGIAAVDQKTGVIVREWAWYPEFAIVMLVPQDSVDTEAITFDGKEALASEYELLLDGFTAAVEQRSIADFAALSTRAFELNAPYLVNPYAQALVSRLPELGALGLNVGHTGTVCGVLYPNTPDGRQCASDVCLEVRRWFDALRAVKVVATPRCPTD
jgi:L-threonine kinase